MARSACAGERLRLLSFNMHAGARTDALHDYVVRSWQHVLPDQDKRVHLREIAEVLRDFDVVALQEVDGGSTRSLFLHQAEHLAKLAGFSECIDQRNRLLGFKRFPILHSGNAVLSRVKAQHVELLALPDKLRGRGAIVVQFAQWTLVNVHLSLAPAAQMRQLQFMSDTLKRFNGAIVIVGDFNCSADHPGVRHLSDALGLHVAPAPPSFPAWNPKRAIDLMLFRGLDLFDVHALPMLASDHLPIAARITNSSNAMRASR
jgi:endonuclease/exonuclease/phosphatase family metal-dependent hydrolase